MFEIIAIQSSIQYFVEIVICDAMVIFDIILFPFLIIVCGETSHLDIRFIFKKMVLWSRHLKHSVLFIGSDCSVHI